MLLSVIRVGPYCAQNGVTESPTISGLTGGTFLVDPSRGIAIASNGTIDLGNSTAGPYLVTYTATDINGCPATSLNQL